MTFSRFISSRLSLSTEANHRTPPGIIVAIGGIALAIAVMLVAIAVTRGFKSEIEGKIEGFEPQLKVAPLYYDPEATASMTEFSPRIESAIRQKMIRYAADSKTGVEVTGVVSVPVLLKTDSAFTGIALTAFEGNHNYGFEQKNLISGRLPAADSSREIALSGLTANQLGLRTGDRVDAIIFEGERMKPRRFKVSGIFSSAFSEFDRTIGYTSAACASRLVACNGLVGYIGVRGLRDNELDEAALTLQSLANRLLAEGEFDAPQSVSTLKQTGAAYFNWLDMLDTNIVVLIVLMGCVSGFMLITCLLILILQRVRMIGVLSALGANHGQLRRIFMQMGVRVIGLGLIIGNAVALGFIGAEAAWHFIPLDSEAYYLTYVPVSLGVWPWIAVNVGFALLALCLMIIPTGMVSRLQPASVINWD